MLVHFIVNNVVINTVEQDSLANPWNYFAVADENASPGWIWDGEKLSAPPKDPVPQKEPDKLDKVIALLQSKSVITPQEADDLKGSKAKGN
jgi:hypothetical protein